MLKCYFGENDCANHKLSLALFKSNTGLLLNTFI